MKEVSTKNAKQEKRRQVQENLPIIRANTEHIESLFGMFAAVSEFEKAYARMPARFKAIPNGKRDIRLLITVLDRLVQDLCCTYPIEKLDSIKRMLPHMRYKTHFGASASHMGEDECVIRTSELETLANNAHEQCKLCVEQNCRKCKLGKVLDSVCVYDRDDRSWANVDFDAIKG